jgi:hypothetical protein
MMRLGGSMRRVRSGWREMIESGKEKIHGRMIKVGR